MSSEGGKQKRIRNRLWLARKHRGLQQKQVAYLLNHKTTDQVSRYEKGVKVPSLQTALLLEIIYGIPVRILFKDLFEQLRDGVEKRIQGNQSLSSIYKNLNAGSINLWDWCAYDELLKSPKPSSADADKVRCHITQLAKILAYL
jgi:transcriptional regulator with XRE-family HTH domain